jgi:hypothetical protein
MARGKKEGIAFSYNVSNLAKIYLPAMAHMLISLCHRICMLHVNVYHRLSPNTLVDV